METNIQFENKEVKFEELCLDPNNPRFTDFGGMNNKVPLERINEKSVQDKVFNRLKSDEFQVKSLRDSILEVGFLNVDRIVVSEISANTYVVVEGNRRLTALKWIMELINSGIVDTKVAKTFSTLLVNVIKPEFDNEINRLKIQGIRHISEIRPWGTYQKAMLIKTMIEDEKLSAQEAANAIGYRTQEVNRVYKAFKLLEQMQEDPDYGEFSTPEHITFFYEAVGRTQIKNFIGYNNTTNEAENEDNIAYFYKWIIKDPDYNNTQKIPSSTNVRELTKIIQNEEALDALKENTTSLEGALAIVLKYNNYDWRKEIKQAIEALKKLPIDELEGIDTNDRNTLSELKEMIEKRISMYDKLFGLG